MYSSEPRFDFSQRPTRAADLIAQPYNAELMTRAALHALSLGCALVPVEYSEKRPLVRRWNDPANLITTPEAAVSRWRTPANIGVQLGASGLISLDVDDLELSRAELGALGVDLDAVLKAHPHPIRGRGVRLWFRAQADDPIKATRQLQVGGRTAFELRAGHGAQDVAPGSLHPSGIVYRWAKTAPQHREDLPAFPDDLRRVYAALLGAKRDDVRPPSPKPARLPSTRPGVGESVIDAFNARVTVAEVLERNGYPQQGARWLSPNSSTKQPGVSLLDGGDRQRAFTHHGSDSWAGKAEDAFGLFRALEHGGDTKAAVKAAARELGMTRPRLTPTAGAETVTAAQAINLWAEHWEDLLLRVSDHLNAQEMHHRARGAMLKLLGEVYRMAGEHLISWRDGFALERGGLKTLAGLIGGHRRDMRARLEVAAALGVIGWTPIDPAQPERGGMIVLPADPRSITPTSGRAVLRPSTRNVRTADSLICPPPKKHGKEGGAYKDSRRKNRPPARQNPLESLTGLALVLSKHRGMTVPDLAARLKMRADTVRRKLAQLDALGYLHESGGLRVTFQQFWADKRAAGGEMTRDRLMGIFREQADWATHALTTRVAADPKERARLNRVLYAAQTRLERLQDGEAPHAALLPSQAVRVAA